MHQSCLVAQNLPSRPFSCIRLQSATHTHPPPSVLLQACTSEPKIYLLGGADPATSTSSPQRVLKDDMTLAEQGVMEGSTIGVAWAPAEEAAEDAEMQEPGEQPAVQDPMEQELNCEASDDGDNQSYKPEIFSPTIAVGGIRVSSASWLSSWFQLEVVLLCTK